MTNPGDKVQIKTKNVTEEGILVPTSEKNVILIKLNNGYNMGFEKNNLNDL